MTQEEKYELAEHKVTLDGKPASVLGRLQDFPIIAQIPGSASAEFSWHTVQHIINHHNGAFKS